MNPKRKFFILSLIAIPVAPSVYGDFGTSSIQEQFYSGTAFGDPNSMQYDNGDFHSIQMEYGSNEAHADASGNISGLPLSASAHAVIPLSSSAQESIYVQSSVTDTFYFLISGPTELVNVHLSATGNNSVQSSSDLPSFSQAFDFLGFAALAAVSAEETLSGIDEFHNAYLPGGPGGDEDGQFSTNNFSIDQDFVAQTNVPYVGFLVAAAAASTSDRTGNPSVNLSSSLEASLNISKSSPRADQYIVHRDPTFTSVPEPTTFGVFGAIAIIGLGIVRRRNRDGFKTDLEKEEKR